MSKHQVAVLKVITRQRSVTAAAAESGISRQHLQRLLRRYRDDGLEAVEPRSRRPRTNLGRTPDAVRDRIIALRKRLSGEESVKEDDADVALAIAAAPKQRTTVRNWGKTRRGP